MSHIKDEGIQMPQFTGSQVFDKKIYNDAIDRAIKKINKNLIKFGDRFPGPVTINNRYNLNLSIQTDISRKPEETGENNGWTTGFWTGMLWLAYRYNHNKTYEQVLDRHIDSFMQRAVKRIDCSHHDMGFLYSLSCVAGYKITGDKKAMRTALLAADILMERYIDKPGIIQAWGDMEDPNERGRMIIDCLMNLSLLYWASETTGNLKYYENAYSHSLKAVNNIIREDATTYHTYFFDVETGHPLYGKTKQGYSDDSCWARGQAWGIYGFVLSYVHTKDTIFLDAAKKLANYFLNRSPDDMVVYWDLIFNDGSGQERDSASTAIVVCGLFEMIKHLENPIEKQYYFNAANHLLRSLCLNYSTSTEDGADGLILHGVYYKAGNAGVDEASLWGDYFYLEALIRATSDWDPYW
ncbi:MAG: glycoside hydrolase family 88 protein [Saccharofermentanales bacterium]